MARLNEANVVLRQGDHRALPEGPRRRRFRCCTSPSSKTATSPTRRSSTSASSSGPPSAEVLGTATFYEMFKFEPVGKYLDQHLQHDVVRAARAPTS